VVTRREDGELLTSIDPGFKVERRAHGPAADGYIVVITWQANAGGTDWAPVDHWELSPEMQRRLAEVLAKHAARVTP
jgi:hypothetical protein